MFSLLVESTKKIEGFYQVCKVKGFTGRQGGVIIPQQNVINLMLDEEVVQAVKEGIFHIYAVENVEQGIEILTGVEAGTINEAGFYPQDTVFGRVQQKLAQYYALVKDESIEKE